MTKHTISPFPPTSNHLHDVHHACGEHDHHGCSDNEHGSTNKRIDERISQAKAHCQQLGIRFTALREQVYRLILQADKPMGAYDLLSEMQQQALANKQSDKKTDSKKAKNIAPPTVYRSLEFLLEQGFIHQLTSINAFVPCCHPRDKHIAGFLICKNCQRVQELSNDSIRQLIEQTKNMAGFAIESSVIEMTGLCQNCQT